MSWSLQVINYLDLFKCTQQGRSDALNSGPSGSYTKTKSNDFLPQEEANLGPKMGVFSANYSKPRLVLCRAHLI